jgi:UDP-N-acetylmuramate--alanine ligase
MKALTELLVGMGWRISGSDLQIPEQTFDWMQRRGLRLHQGHDVSYLPENVDLLVYSPAVSPQNPERLQAAARGVPQFSYNEMLGYLMQDKVGVCIAGTHGKSTTTAMTACVLTSAGLDPSVIVGAELCGRGASGWAGEGNLFVVESCEYQRNFLHLTPQFAAILGIEPDHFDCFRNFDETIAAFEAFAARIPSDGVLVVHGDCEASQAAILASAAEVQTFSLSPGSDWWAADLRTTKSGVRFRVFHQGDYFTELALQVPGRHNVLNALAATAVCYRAGADREAIREGFREFSGIRRRFEAVGSWRGVMLIDDYAHHPTAIRATLETARERFEGRRILCVFQPHQVSRTRALMTEFASSFGDADEILVTPVYGARENFRTELDDASRELATRIAAEGTRARFCASLDQTLTTLEDEALPGDILITMGAGNIDQIHHAFTRRLQRHYPPR